MKKQILLLTAVVLTAISFRTMAQVPSYVPASGLISYYGFDNTGNDVISFSIPTANTAIPASDRFGNGNSAYQFNDTTVILYDGANPMGTIGNNHQNFSMNFWVYTTDTLGSMVLGSYGWGYYVNLDNTNKIHLTYCDPFGAWTSYNSLSSISINNWHMVSVIKSGSNFTIYIDNVLDNTIANIPDIRTYPSYNCWFGANGQDNNGHLHGKLDDIGIWNRALNQNEITNLYTANICYQNITVTDTLLININFTGFNPITYQNTLKIWPNPTNDHITIDNGNIANCTGYQIIISNTLGQQVFQSAINQQQFYIDMSTWGGNGLYFVNIINAQGVTIDTKKIVLQE